jgi:hypothetical protein
LSAAISSGVKVSDDERVRVAVPADFFESAIGGLLEI